MEREAVTIRFPVDLLSRARQFKDDLSFNELVVVSLEQEVRRRQALAAHQRIVARRAEIQASTGLQANTAELVRQLREGQRE